jgi:K+-transporting ATPase KdpF subunit
VILGLAMGWDDFVGIILATLGAAYLVFALIKPEKL